MKDRKLEIPVLFGKEGESIAPLLQQVNGIQQMASRKGYQVKLYSNADQILADRSPGDAVIVTGYEAMSTPISLRTLFEAGMKVIVTNMDSDHIDSRFSCATFSRRACTEQTLAFLLGKGCKHLALVGCGERSVNDMVHYDAMEQYLSHVDGVTWKSFWYRTEACESFESFHQRCQDYDAVLTTNGYVAAAFVRFCEEQGLSIPDDFLLMSLKGARLCECCRPQITTCEVDYQSIGESSVLIWRWLKDAPDERIQLRIIVPGQIIPRESTGDPDVNHPLPNIYRNVKDTYQGGPFYTDESLNVLRRIEQCLQAGDSLDRRIMTYLMSDMSYEEIEEKAYLSGSSLRYRVKKIFLELDVNSRKEFRQLISGSLTSRYQLSED